MPIICVGCNVNIGHEHRCHKETAFVRGEPTGQPCECRECKVADQLFSGDCSHKLKEIGVWQGRDQYGKKISGPKLRCNLSREEICPTWSEWFAFGDIKKIGGRF